MSGGLSRRAVVVLLGATLLAQAWALTSTRHPAPHPGGDNAGYVALAHSLESGRGYVEAWDPAAPPHTKYPPVFPALLAAALAAGVSTWGGLKAVPLLFGFLAVAATFLWARARRGPVQGAAVALLTGWSVSLVYHANFLLSDVPFLAFTMAALWLAAEGRGEASVAPVMSVEGDGGGVGDPSAEDATVGSRDFDAAPAGEGWPAAAVAGALVFAGLAYFTRSAGLPLVGAILLVLVVRRRFAAALAGAVVVGAPAALWLLRARGAAGQGAYGREFWMVDPYAPERGEIGLLGLVPRALENAGGYLTAHLPFALLGPGTLAGLLGLAVGVLAVVGWGRAVRERVGVAEVFAPLYLGLLLVWPPVWSGDRFALPLVPLAVLYAGEALAWGVARLRAGAVAPVLAGAVGVLLLVQAGGVLRSADDAARCRGAVRAGGPWACSGLGMVQFTEAARWAGANLPADAAFLTRKPRIWYVMGGRASRTYPFVASADSLLAAAAEAGASYVVLDLVGSQAEMVALAIGERPTAFCTVAGFGEGQPRTELLGIPGGGGGPPPGPGEEVWIDACPEALLGGDVVLESYDASSPIPILTSSPPP